MPKSQRKRISLAGAPTHTWSEVIEDAEADIRRAERRIEQLRLVVANARIKLEAGEPFPAEAVDGR